MYTIEDKGAIPIRRILAHEPGARGLQHSESVPLAETFRTRLLGSLSCLPPTRSVLYKIEADCCHTELGEACGGHRAARE